MEIQREIVELEGTKANNLTKVGVKGKGPRVVFVAHYDMGQPFWGPLGGACGSLRNMGQPLGTD